MKAIKLSEGRGIHGRTKHIDVKYHYVRGEVEDGTVELSYVATLEQLADILA